jgi:Protein of unknown function, DUF481
VSEILRRETNAPSPADQVLAGGHAQRLVSSSVMVANAVPRPVAATNGWHGEVRFGLDLIYDATHQEVFNGRLQLNYLRPYESDPTEHFRNAFDLSIAYGRTYTQTNAFQTQNQLSASDKTGWDVGRRYYVYNLIGLGYDEIQNINFRYEEGPGLGYHVYTRTNLTLNAESGVDLQVQYREGSPDTRDFFFRMAEDLAWKPIDRVTWTEKLELYPRVDFGELRYRFESNIAYAIWRKLSLNFTLLDVYDSHPADDATRNDLEIRSALGYGF